MNTVTFTESTLQNEFHKSETHVLGDLRKFGTPAKVRQILRGICSIYPFQFFNH